MTAEEKLRAILVELGVKQRKAAMSNKPTMWAYYHTMRSALTRWFSWLDSNSIGGAALALIQQAERHQKDHPIEAARWAALAVYARRIFRVWVPDGRLTKKAGTKADLSWLRKRANEPPITGKGYK